MGKLSEWQKITLILCIFGFFREFRPSDPFHMEFLMEPYRNVTIGELHDDILPIGVYSYMIHVVLIFLVVDYILYQPVIIISGFTGVMIWSMLLATHSNDSLKTIQVFYGTYNSAEIAYYTYIYAKVEITHFMVVSSQTRSAMLCGRLLSSILGQILISSETLDIRELNYITLAFQFVSLIIAVILPKVNKNLYFHLEPELNFDMNARDLRSVINIEMDDLPENSDHRNVGIQTNDDTAERLETFMNARNKNKKREEEEEEPPKTAKSMMPFGNCAKVVRLLVKQFIHSYSNMIILEWSIWWALATCGYLLVRDNSQFLWREIDPNQDVFYNGATEAALTFFSTVASLAAGIIHNTAYQRCDLWIITICSLVQTFLVLMQALVKNIYVVYVMYILFGTMYQFVITFASGTIAKALVIDSFGLVFGFNMFVALFLQSIFTVFVMSGMVFRLNVPGQFCMFAGYFGGLSGLYGVSGMITFCTKRKQDTDK